MKENNLKEISKYLRYLILKSTTSAGSGHPTSSLSAVELMTALMFGGVMKYRVDEPKYFNNDKLIISKGHASPLLYSLWSIAGVVDEKELMALRKFESNLEGHPTINFSHTEVATGSLGQGLSVGVGMALNAKMDELSYKTYVLLGDSEMAEGQNWEAMQVAAYYKLDNLVGIIDVNRLGQRGETMYGYKTSNYSNKVRSFGWHVEEVDGHNIEEILLAYQQAKYIKDKPTMIVAKTVKGKGISFLENKEGWHGKVLNAEELEKALEELGDVESVVGGILEPKDMELKKTKSKEINKLDIKDDYKKPMATRKAYGQGLVKMHLNYPEMVVLDAEVSNSTYSGEFKRKYSDKFIEMFIAEQNMVSAGVGLALCGKIPFISTFAAFFTRAFDQIRMASHNGVKIIFVGSHGGVSIGEDGLSQMGLEDIAMFRAILNSTVIYPADHVATEKLMIEMMKQKGIGYMRTTRMDTEPLYDFNEKFKIGGSKVLKSSDSDRVTVIGAGVTLYEALEAHRALIEEGVNIRVIDLYSIKPVDIETLVMACKETMALVVVEDHFAEGGMAEAVRSALVHEATPIYSLAVKKMPRSGKAEKLLAYEEIDSKAIINKIKSII